MLTTKIFEKKFDRIYVSLDDYKDFDPEKIGAIVHKTYPQLIGESYIIDVFMNDDTPVSSFITSIFVHFKREKAELN